MTSQFWKILAFLLFPCLIGIPHCLADIVVPVSISQQVSVSGGVFACDPLCQLGLNGQDNGGSFSSSDANTQLPPKTSLSQSGGASDTVPEPTLAFDRMASVDALASQTFTLNPTNFNLHLSSNGSFSGNSTLQSAGVNAASQYSLVFDLNSPSVVHLTGQISGHSNAAPFSFLSGLFDGEIHLAGPGLQFDQALSFPFDSFEQQPFDQSFTLGPGQYTLEASAAMEGSGSYHLDSGSFLDVSLDADFTSAVPEPARVSAVGVLMVLGLFFARRHAPARFR